MVKHIYSVSGSGQEEERLLGTWKVAGSIPRLAKWRGVPEQDI